MDSNLCQWYLDTQGTDQWHTPNHNWTLSLFKGTCPTSPIVTLLSMLVGTYVHGFVGGTLCKCPHSDHRTEVWVRYEPIPTSPTDSSVTNASPQHSSTRLMFQNHLAKKGSKPSLETSKTVIYWLSQMTDVWLYESMFTFTVAAVKMSTTRYPQQNANQKGYFLITQSLVREQPLTINVDNTHVVVSLFWWSM